MESSPTHVPRARQRAAGQYQDGAGKDRVRGVYAGQHQDLAGATDCKNCTAGQYQQQAGPAHCIQNLDDATAANWTTAQQEIDAVHTILTADVTAPLSGSAAAGNMKKLRTASTTLLHVAEISIKSCGQFHGFPLSHRHCNVGQCYCKYHPSCAQRINGRTVKVAFLH